MEIYAELRLIHKINAFLTQRNFQGPHIIREQSKIEHRPFDKTDEFEQVKKNVKDCLILNKHENIFENYAHF